MICNQDPTRFYGVNTLRDNFYISSAEESIKGFLDCGFLNIGGFINVNIPTSGLYGSNFSSCKPVQDPSRPQNTVWQAPRKDWIWESNVVYKNTSPTNISGVYINNTLYPAPTGNSTVPYKLDYENGQILFNNSISSNSKVELSYSYRWCQVSKISSNINLWKKLQQLTFQPDNITKQNEVLSNNRIQLPAIIIETTSRNKTTPYELGSLVSFRDQDILLHIYTENINDCNTIMDIIRLQEDKTLILYDYQKVVESGLYGLNPDGSKNINGLNYGQLIQNPNLYWNKMLLKNISFMDIQKNPTSNLFWCMIRLTSELVM